MDIEISTMSAGELFDRGLQLLLEHFKILYIPVLVLAAPLQLVFAVIQPGLYKIGASVHPGSSELPKMMAVSMSLFLFSWILIAFINGVAARAILDRALEGRMSLVMHFKRMLGTLPSLLSTLFLSGAVIFGAAGSLFLAGAYLLPAGPFGRSMAILLFLAAAILSVYLALALALTPHAVVLEKRSGLKAMRRSRSLIKGNLWQFLLVAIILGLVALMFHVICHALPSAVELPSDPWALGWGISTVLKLVFDVYIAVVVALFYIDVRVRKEGFDPAAWKRDAGMPFYED